MVDQRKQTNYESKKTKTKKNKVNEIQMKAHEINIKATKLLRWKEMKSRYLKKTKMK